MLQGNIFNTLLHVALWLFLVGVSTTQPDHLKFVYENHEDFSVLPTFIVWKAMAASAGVYSEEHGLPIDPTMVGLFLIFVEM